MQIDMTDEERDILIRWKKRSDTYRLVRMKAEAIVYVPVVSAWILSRRWSSGPRGRYVSGCRNGGDTGWAPW